MPAECSPSEIIVVGAGVLGLATAAELALRGRSVTVIDPGCPNASSVAAGMLAPAMEALLDACDMRRSALLKAARDLWPAFAEKTAITLCREGAEWRGAAVRAAHDRLIALGFQVRLTEDSGVFTPEDWRLEPVSALAALGRVAGVTMIKASASAVDPNGEGWRVWLADGARLDADRLVVATGWSSGAMTAPDAVAALMDRIIPIRGQIEVIAATPVAHILRSAEGYVAPGAGGGLAGASMDVGRTDLAPDATQTAHYRAVAATLTGQASGQGASRVGIRGASPDGLPMAGLTSPGLAVALAPRRNGWLLAPLVAATVADALDGTAPGPWATALEPTRFG